MTGIKKITSIALAATMTLSLMTPAMAAEKEVPTQLLDSNEIALSVENNSELILYAEDYDNGDARVCMIENGKTIYEAYFDCSKNLIISTDYQTGEVYTTNCEKIATNMTCVAGESTGYINQGKITYNYYIQGMVAGQKYLNVAYNKTTNPYASFDPSGKYRRVADFALFFVSHYAMATKAAIGVAAKVMSICDIASDATDFIIPTLSVDAVKTTLEWKGTVGTKQMCKITGMRYNFKIKGTQHTEYEQMYHSENSFKNHEKSLANDLYDAAWGNDTRDIVSWS